MSTPLNAARLSQRLNALGERIPFPHDASHGSAAIGDDDGRSRLHFTNALA
jgi:hypothetical protein